MVGQRSGARLAQTFIMLLVAILPAAIQPLSVSVLVEVMQTGTVVKRLLLLTIFLNYR